MTKAILLVADDPKTIVAVREGLGAGYQVEVAADEQAAAQLLGQNPPALIIIDHDLRVKDGLQVYKNLRPAKKVIMLSASGNIPLAVTAAKLGVAEFLRKPLDSAQLRAAVAALLAEPPVSLKLPAELAWLQGQGEALRQFFALVRRLLPENRDVILVGEPGIDRRGVAELLHFNRQRKFMALNLAAFKGETLEAHFWVTLQELLAWPDPSSVQHEEDRCGTIFLDRLDELDETFKNSLLSFLKDRPGRIDRNIRVVIGVQNENAIKSDLPRLTIPPLRQRKEDLPALLAGYNCEIASLPVETLVLLSQYDWPGNYEELEAMVRQAALSGNFAVTLYEIMNAALNQSLSAHLTLDEARRVAEKKLYAQLLKETKSDVGAVARFVDQPRTTLADRLEDLAD